MQLFAKANWWLPGWLDRLLPTVHLERSDAAVSRPPEPPAAEPERQLEPSGS